MRYDSYMKSMLQSLIEKRRKILIDSVVVRNCGPIGHWNVARPMNAHHIEVDSLRCMATTTSLDIKPNEK